MEALGCVLVSKTMTKRNKKVARGLPNKLAHGYQGRHKGGKCPDEPVQHRKPGAHFGFHGVQFVKYLFHVIFDFQVNDIANLPFSDKSFTSSAKSFVFIRSRLNHRFAMAKC